MPSHAARAARPSRGRPLQFLHACILSSSGWAVALPSPPPLPCSPRPTACGRRPAARGRRRSHICSSPPPPPRPRRGPAAARPFAQLPRAEPKEMPPLDSRMAPADRAPPLRAAAPMPKPRRVATGEEPASHSTRRAAACPRRSGCRARRAAHAPPRAPPPPPRAAAGEARRWRGGRVEACSALAQSCCSSGGVEPSTSPASNRAWRCARAACCPPDVAASTWWLVVGGEGARLAAPSTTVRRAPRAPSVGRAARGRLGSSPACAMPSVSPAPPSSCCRVLMLMRAERQGATFGRSAAAAARHLAPGSAPGTSSPPSPSRRSSSVNIRCSSSASPVPQAGALPLCGKSSPRVDRAGGSSGAAVMPGSPACLG